MKTTFILILTFTFSIILGQEAKRELLINKKYLNLPVQSSQPRKKIILEGTGADRKEFVIRLSNGKPDYWVFLDVSDLNGKRLSISYPERNQGFDEIYQSDQIAGSDSLYKEVKRPQIHFTTRRGWINDPNGMIFYKGEYHLFYQHNPMERDWENMSWGHAVSSDLIHWQELPVVMYPDSLGSIFSGTCVIDYKNTSGFGKNGIPPMIAIYTVDGSGTERQCLAYSLDNGRTFTKYRNNPVIDSKVKWNSRDLRDPKVFWHEPSRKWIMVLYERDGNSIYTSPNLKDWNYESHVTGFFECPQFFELPVDKNPNNTKWVMYGASGTYMTGSFDGKAFRPEAGKYYYGNGALYAAQTFENMPPSDGRRIQIGWGRIPQPGMPFNNMMLLPTELTLRSTKEGIRLFNTPVKELEMLQEKEYAWEHLDAETASEKLNQLKASSCLRIKAILRLSHSTDAGVAWNGQELFKYDMNNNLINGLFYSPEDRTSMEISVDMILDKTSAEIFVDEGAFSYAIERKTNANSQDGFRFFGNAIEVKDLKVYPLKSIWK